MFKFLDPTGATYYDEKPFYYTLPRPDQKWSDTTMHPAPAKPDGEACGAGRLHLMNRLDARYAPHNWWPWWARGITPIGGDDEKTSFAGVQLRRISPKLFARCLRFGWGSEADLSRANLSGADLSRANLSGADLRWANLSGANLSEADLSRANLSGADLRWANLSGANLSGADLRWANLSGANLSGADLSEADLSWANLSEANLRRAIICNHTILPSDLNTSICTKVDD